MERLRRVIGGGEEGAATAAEALEAVEWKRGQGIDFCAPPVLSLPPWSESVPVAIDGSELQRQQRCAASIARDIAGRVAMPAGRARLR